MLELIIVGICACTGARAVKKDELRHVTPFEDVTRRCRVNDAGGFSSLSFQRDALMHATAVGKTAQHDAGKKWDCTTWWHETSARRKRRPRPYMSSREP